MITACYSKYSVFIFVILGSDLPAIESETVVTPVVFWRKLYSQAHLKLASDWSIYKYLNVEDLHLWILQFQDAKSSKSFKHELHTNEIVDNNPSANETSDEESTSSEQEIFFHPQPSTSRSAQVMPSYMPYVEGPTMDWTVNDGLYNRFLKCHLQCENIIECELVILSESRKCQKVLAWSGDFGLDQYISQNLSSKNVILETM